VAERGTKKKYVGLEQQRGKERRSRESVPGGHNNGDVGRAGAMRRENKIRQRGHGKEEK